MRAARDILSEDEEPVDRLVCAATPGTAETSTDGQIIRGIPKKTCLRLAGHQTTNGVDYSSVTRWTCLQWETGAEAASWCLLQRTMAGCFGAFVAAVVDGVVDAIDVEPWSVPILRRSHTQNRLSLLAVADPPFPLDFIT